MPVPRRFPVSCAFCTTNGLAPMVKAIHDKYEIEEALATQAVGGGGKHNRDPEGRAAVVDAQGRDLEGGVVVVDAQRIACAGPGCTSRGETTSVLLVTEGH